MGACIATFVLGCDRNDPSGVGCFTTGNVCFSGVGICCAGYGDDAAFVGTGRCYVESEGRGMDIPADRYLVRRGLLRYISRDE